MGEICGSGISPGEASAGGLARPAVWVPAMPRSASGCGLGEHRPGGRWGGSQNAEVSGRRPASQSRDFADLVFSGNFPVAVKIGFLIR